MNLNQVNAVIAALDKKAEDYKAAADSLRTVLAHENAESTKSAPAAAASFDENATATKSNAGRKSNAGAKAAAVSNGAKPKRSMSPETRAKIAEKIKARHAARKQGK